MRILTASIFGLLMSVPAMAGEQPAADLVILQKLSGKVLANVGQGYGKAVRGMDLKNGDSLMLGANGRAVLYFTKARCSATLPAAQVTTVAGPEMCQQAAAPRSLIQQTSDQASDIVITPTQGGTPVAGEIPPQLIAGGVFVLGAAAAINSFNEKGSPISGP